MIIDAIEMETERSLNLWTMWFCAMLDQVRFRTSGIVGVHLLIVRSAHASDQSRDIECVAQRPDGCDDRKCSGHHQEFRWVAH